LRKKSRILRGFYGEIVMRAAAQSAQPQK